MGALMADEPLDIGGGFVGALGIADALEAHDDQAGQDAATHALKARRRAAPAGHDGRAVGLAGAETARVIVRDARRPALNCGADPGGQPGVGDGDDPLGLLYAGLAEQDVEGAVLCHGLAPALALDQHGAAAIPPGDTGVADGDVLSVQVLRQVAGDLQRRQGEDVEGPGEQGDRAVGEGQHRIVGLEIVVPGRDLQPDVARHGTAVEAAQDVEVADALQHHAGGDDGPVGRAPGPARFHQQRRADEGPDGGVLAEGVVDRPLVAVARDRYIGARDVGLGQHGRGGRRGRRAGAQRQDGGQSRCGGQRAHEGPSLRCAAP